MRSSRSASWSSRWRFAELVKVRRTTSPKDTINLPIHFNGSSNPERNGFIQITFRNGSAPHRWRRPADCVHAFSHCGSASNQCFWSCPVSCPCARHIIEACFANSDSAGGNAAFQTGPCEGRFELEVMVCRLWFSIGYRCLNSHLSRGGSAKNRRRMLRIRTRHLINVAPRISRHPAREGRFSNSCCRVRSAASKQPEPCPGHAGRPGHRWIKEPS